MPTSHDPLETDQDGQSNIPADVQEIDADFRRDLGFQSFTDEMVQRLRGYGQEEIVPENRTLYTHGDRDSDMFVVLDGEIEVALRSLNGGYFAVIRGLTIEFASHRACAVSGKEVLGTESWGTAKPHCSIGGPSKMDGNGRQHALIKRSADRSRKYVGVARNISTWISVENSEESGEVVRRLVYVEHRDRVIWSDASSQTPDGQLHREQRVPSFG